MEFLPSAADSLKGLFGPRMVFPKTANFQPKIRNTKNTGVWPDTCVFLRCIGPIGVSTKRTVPLVPWESCHRLFPATAGCFSKGTIPTLVGLHWKWDDSQHGWRVWESCLTTLVAKSSGGKIAVIFEGKIRKRVPVGQVVEGGFQAVSGGLERKLISGL